MDKAHPLLELLRPREVAKLERLAEACGTDMDERFLTKVLRNLVKVVPGNVRDVHLVSAKAQEAITDLRRDGDLVEVVLRDGTRLVTFPSRQQYRNHYYAFRHLLPSLYGPETYQACNDVEMRYLRGRRMLDHLRRAGLFRPTERTNLVECGAYNGWKALGFATHLGAEGHLTVIEMDPRQFALVQRNLAANLPTDRWSAHNVGIWHEEGEASYTYEHPASHSLREPDEHDHHTQTGTIRTTTLDRVLADDGYDQVDFINIQTGGSELESVQGMLGSLDRVKVAYVGSHYHHDGVSIRSRAMTLLLQHGCRLYVRPDRERPTHLVEATMEDADDTDAVGGFYAVTPRWVDDLVPRS